MLDRYIRVLAYNSLLHRYQYGYQAERSLTQGHPNMVQMFAKFPKKVSKTAVYITC